MSIGRRSFLSMMAALPLVSAAKSLAEIQPSTLGPSNFYVWVHGVFGMSWIAPTPTTPLASVEIFCPSLYESGNCHRYFIGRITKADRPVDLDDLPCGLIEYGYQNAGQNGGKTKKYETTRRNYSFCGLSKGGDDNPIACDCDGFPVLSGTLRNDFDGYRFCLPNPQSVLPLRGFRVRCKPEDGSHLPQNPFVLPMCHVLVYENVVPRHVKVQCTDDSSWLWKGGHSRHLHLFVEPASPESEGGGHDSSKTLKTLLSNYCAECFDLEAKERCPRFDNISDFCDDLEEQMFLYEWSGTNFCSAHPERTQATFKPQGCPQFVFAPPLT